MAQRVCVRCGKTFTANGAKRKDTALYCSNECRRNRVTKICVTCGKQFEVKMSDSDNVCCSFPCRNAALRRRRQEEIERKFGKPIFALLYDLYCIQGLGIKRIAHTLGVSDSKLWEWFVDLGIERRTRSDAVALQWLGNDERKAHQREIVQKAIANGTFDRYRIVRIAKTDWARKRNSESKQGDKNWMFKRGGPLNPQWNGGKIYYYGPSWNSQRNAARKRDNYTCQYCGVTEDILGKQLDVHHIRKFRHFGLDHHEQANHLDNLICLCPQCHIIAEVQSGRDESIDGQDACSDSAST